VNAGVDDSTRATLQAEQFEAERKQKEEAEAKRKEREARTQVIVPGRRWDFKFQDISVEGAGKDGRGRHAVGARYGFPHEDRKKGMIKIPTSVD
jgi:hypothetical protein